MATTEMTIDRAVEILSDASRGQLTNNAEFKVACAMGKLALIELQLGHDAEQSPIRVEPLLEGAEQR